MGGFSSPISCVFCRRALLSHLLLPLLLVLCLIPLTASQTPSPSASPVLLEVEFDLSQAAETADGYTAADAMNAFLQSPDLQWLRYYVNFLSGKSGHVRMRTAHFQFANLNALGAWTHANQNHIHSLFDHFWIGTRRWLWQVTTNTIDLGGAEFPKRTPPEDGQAGYLYQFLYTVVPGKEKDFKEAWNHLVPVVVVLAGHNAGFLSRSHYSSVGFQSEFPEMEQFEFSSMTSMVELINNQAFVEMIKELSKFTSKTAVNILHPGADDGSYWPAEGAEKGTNEDL